MQNLMWVGLVGAIVALLFALIQRNKVMSFSEGNDRMKKIAGSIREGANAYLKHQYTTVAKVFIKQSNLCQALFWLLGIYSSE